VSAFAADLKRDGDAPHRGAGRAAADRGRRPGPALGRSSARRRPSFPAGVGLRRIRTVVPARGFGFGGRCRTQVQPRGMGENFDASS